MTEWPKNPVAWLHTLHMEQGQTSTRLTDWDCVDPDEPTWGAFGRPGRDYSEEYRVTTQPPYTHPPATDVAALVEHFRRMIEACANYVEPTTYIARHPTGELCKWNTEFPEPRKHQSIDGALATTRRRDQAFISDMIYMLDGPEQRAALAPFTKVGQP